MFGIFPNQDIPDAAFANTRRMDIYERLAASTRQCLVIDRLVDHNEVVSLERSSITDFELVEPIMVNVTSCFPLSSDLPEREMVYVRMEALEALLSKCIQLGYKGIADVQISIESAMKLSDRKEVTVQALGVAVRFMEV